MVNNVWCKQSLMVPGLKRSLACLWLGLLAVLPLAGPAAAQARLGSVEADGRLRLPLAQMAPLSRLRVEVDGQARDLPLALSGRDLIVTLPPDLAGISHDITLYRVEPGGDVELGTWLFETPTGATDVTLTGRIEAGLAQGPAGAEARLNGSGRIGFDRDDGRWRGSLGFLQRQEEKSRDPRTDITDYFLEHRGAAFGDALIARIGTQDLPGTTLAMDDAARRGLSLRLQDPAGRSDLALFALSPNDDLGRRNLTGLSDPQDRLTGLAAKVLPFAGRGFQVDLLAYRGRATEGYGTVAEVAGQGLRLSGPVAFWPGGSFKLSYAQSDHEQPLDGFPLARSGTALAAELGFGLLPQGDEQSLSLTLSADQTSPDFIAPLNPDLLPDERGAGLSLLWQSPFWQWQAEARRARDNLDDLAAEPTEGFSDLSLDLYYLPGDFTGGPLNGMTFFASALREDQRRRHSPATGPAPQDFRLQSLSFGMDKFQPDYAWALSINHEALRYTGANPRAGEVERDLWLEGLYAWTPDDRTTLTLGGEVGRLTRAGLRHDRVGAEIGFAWDLTQTGWSALLEGGVTEDRAPGAENGRWFGAELIRDLTPQSQAVLRADYGRGSDAPDLAPQGGWVLGLALRHDLGGR